MDDQNENQKLDSNYIPARITDVMNVVMKYDVLSPAALFTLGVNHGTDWDRITWEIAQTVHCQRHSNKGANEAVCAAINEYHKSKNK